MLLFSIDRRAIKYVGKSGTEDINRCIGQREVLYYGISRFGLGNFHFFQMSHLIFSVRNFSKMLVSR